MSCAPPVAVVNAFTAQPFSGNPAGVCWLSTPAPKRAETWLQHVARELAHPETAFVSHGTLPGHFTLRWFTPLSEVDLCGHATLAAAHWLWERGEVAAELHFHTRSGVLKARRENGQVWLDFPVQQAQALTEPRALLAAALNVCPKALRWTGANRLDYLVELSSAADVRALRPNLAAFGELGQRGIIATAAGEGRYDCVSRGFFPNVGIPEDPVTGSAHCALAPYWGARLGKRELLGRQVSARGGDVCMRWQGPRVQLGGEAVTIWEGALRYAPPL